MHLISLFGKSSSWNICFLQNRDSDLSETVLFPPFCPFVKKIGKTRLDLKKYARMVLIGACFKKKENQRRKSRVRVTFAYFSATGKFGFFP